MNPSPLPQYKRFKLFNNIEPAVDEDGRRVSRQSNSHFKLDHIDIMDMKLSKDTTFILGRVLKAPKKKKKSVKNRKEENENNNCGVDLKSQVGKTFIFKYYNSQLLDQYELYSADILAFEVLNFSRSNYIISFGKDLSMENGLTTKLKIHDITDCVDPNRNDSKPRELFSQVLMRQETGNGMSILFEHKHFDDLMLDDITMVRATEDMSAVALVADKKVIFLMCKGAAIWKCSEEDINVVLFYGSSGAMITNVIIRNKEEYVIEGEKHKTISFYYTSTDGVFYGTVHSNTGLIEVEKVRNVSGIQKNCLLLDSNQLIVASIITQSIIVIESGKIKNEYPFQGVITYLHKHKHYLCFCLTSNNSYFLGVFDPEISIFQYYAETGDEIKFILSNADTFMYLVKKPEEKKNGNGKENEKKNDEEEEEEEEDNKESLTKVNVLKEKDDKEKFKIFYSKHFYDCAINYAISLRYTPKQIVTIRSLYADYLYAKENYEKAIEQYVHTINYLEPSIVIQKYFTDENLDFLITYLEALRLNEAFMTKLLDEERNNYTGLLISCYIKQKKITKLEHQ